MSKYLKKLLSLLLVLVLVLGLFPTYAAAGEARKLPAAKKPDYVFTEEDHAILQEDVFAKIDAVKAEAAATMGGIGKMTEQDYAAIEPAVIAAIKSSDTYLEGTLQQNGSFLVWETTVGLPCFYSPRLEAELNNTANDPTPLDIAKAEERAAALSETFSEVRGGAAASPKIGLIQPFWESTSNYADSSFNSYSPSYKAMWESLAAVTGGSTMRYTMSNATIDNIASTMSQCGLVIFDSHGDTDYASGSDYTSQANTSYLCLTSTSGFTSADTAAQTGPYGTYYHAMVSGSHGYIDGTAIANHMPSNAPNSLLYMGICLGMATDGMHKGLREKGVEVVHGYSQSVTFVGEEMYMSKILGYVKDGDTYSSAINKAKDELGWWDPLPSYSDYTEAQAAANRVAFPIVVSSEDVYPGHGNVDAIQNVYSTWVLLGDTYEINAVPNNPDWGTVNLIGYTINAVPAEGYYAAGAEVLSGTATVNQLDANTFYVNPTSDCSVQINFAPKTPAVVTYVSSGTTVGTVNTFVGDDVILPTDVTEVPDWTFVGWVTDHISITTEKPVFMKPGASFTVNAENVTIFAVYKHVEGNGGTVYQLVTEAPRGVWDGRYVISSSTADTMSVMSGVSGNSNIESGSLGYTAFASTGIELEDNVLRNVDDAYIFEVAEQGDNAYSFQNVGAGSYLAVYDSYFWVRENYESGCCNWTITPSASGAILKCTASTSYPYLSWSGSKWMASSGSSYVQLWKEYDDGTTYYWTDPVVEEHEHEMTAYPAVAPTCGAEGHSAYYQCSVCFKYFSDAAGENEITLASTVIPATGEHVFDAWASNNDGSHKHVCAVCGAQETEPCVYDEGVVTPPTPTTQGYTTYTCTVCGYTYNGDYTQALGTDFTVQFSVPAECEQPNDMTSNTNTGITLPVIEGPEGYKFLGWVDDIYDNVDTKPDGILTGHYVAPYDITLYALFKYVDAEGGSGVSAFELVTEDPGDWSGNYVITYGNTTSLYVMKGMAGGTSYETNDNGSAVAYASTGMTLEDSALADVADDYIFELKQEASGNYSIFNNAFNSYVGIESSTLYAVGSYSASICDWRMSLNTSGYTDAYLSAGGSWPYIAFSTYSHKFWCYSSNNGIYFWKETDGGTPYWTTIIGEPDPGVDYTVTFTTPAGVTAPAPMVINSMSGANLPTVEAPEGYSFLGWVLDDYDNVDVKPVRIYSGKFRPQADTTLKALFTYVVDGEGIGYELVTENQADWTGNYVISCYETPEKMILMGAVAGGNTYEAANNGGVVLFSGSGASLENNVLTGVPDNCVFSIQPLGGGYTIQNLGNSSYVGRNVTTASQSARLHSYAAYEANYCRWSFTWGDHGSTDTLYNVMIQHVNDAGLDGSYPYLGCGYYYFFSEDEHTENYPYFWVDGTGENYDSDVYYMYLWKETGAGTRYWTTVIGEEPAEDLVDVYFVDQDDNTNAYVYAFGDNDQNAAFPGELLTAEGVDENGDNWYKITLDRSVYTNVIFSGGDSSTQTADLGLGEGAYIVYYVNNRTGYVGADVWPAPAVVVEPTCTEAGTTTYTGLLTGETHVTTVDALGHLPGEPVEENRVEPTATEDGGYDTVVYCQRCNAELSREHTVLPATGTTLDLTIENTLALEGATTLNYFVKKADLDAYHLDSFKLVVVHTAYVDGEFVDESVDLDGVIGSYVEQTVDLTPRSILYGEGEEYYWFEYKDIAAKELNDKMVAHLEGVKDGVTFTSAEKDFNPMTYCYTIAQRETSNMALRKTCADLIKYCAAAQICFNYNTANPADADWSLIPEGIATEGDPELANYKEIIPLEGQTCEIKTYTLDASGRVNINFLVKPDDMDSCQSLKLVCNYKDVKGNDVVIEIPGSDWTFYNNTYGYMAVLNTVNAGEMREVISAKVQDANGEDVSNVYKTSIETYAWTIVDRNNNVPLMNMMKAMLNYGTSAHEFLK